MQTHVPRKRLDDLAGDIRMPEPALTQNGRGFSVPGTCCVTGDIGNRFPVFGCLPAPDLLLGDGSRGWRLLCTVVPGPMQNVQLKQTQETDVVAPLRAYLSQHFTDSEFHQLEPALDDLRQFRDQVRLGCQRGQLDYDRLSHSHEEYLAFLVGLGDRFPFGAHATGGLFKRKPVKTVMIQWLWSDAYRPQKFAVDYTLQFELSAVTFNLAAIQTYQALSYERDSANGVQAAAKCFMKAAGIFQHMATAMSVHVPGYDVVDLSSSSLNYLSTCMLAQAASCSFENAVMKPMAPAVLAVLAMGVSETYASARTILKGDPQLVSWIAKSDFIDERFLTYQLLCFEAAANYWQSQKDEADAAYGVVVARLQNAKAVLQSCLNVEPKADSVRASRKKLQDAIELRLKSAVRDNDTIYHYPVPSAVELPAIQSKLVVKPVPFAMPKAKLPKVFDRLVPVEVQVAIQRFKTEMGDEIAKISETCSESSELARESLAQMNLPAALDALDADNAMPAEITTRIENIQAKGGLSGLDQLHAQVVKSAASSWEMYNEISSLLKQEQANEDKFRSTYGAKWERTPSKDITSTYYRDLGTVSKYLSQAKEADLKVSTKLDQSRESLAMISKPLPDIEASLPVLDASEKTEASERVRAVLRDLSSLLRKRERLLEQFMEAVGAHDPTSSIMAKKSEVGVDEVLRDEKNAFESNRQQIDENLAKQSGLFDTLVEANQAFIASRTKSTQLDERQRCLQRINDAVATFEKLEKNLTEGLSFYTDLLKDYLTPLKENVLGYATARDHEARLLLDDLSKHFAQATTLNSQGPPTPVGLPSPSRQQAHQVPPSQHAYQVPPNQQAYQVPPNQQAYQMPPSQQVYQQAPMQPPVQPAMQQHAFLPPSYQAPYQSGPSLPRNPFESPPTSPASNPFAPPPPDPSAPSAPPYY